MEYIFPIAYELFAAAVRVSFAQRLSEPMGISSVEEAKVYIFYIHKHMRIIYILLGFFLTLLVNRGCHIV